MDVATWLRQLGLDQYQSAFNDNAVDMEVLSRLTAEDLKEIGVTAVGHRRKLLDAIALLGNMPEHPQGDAPSGSEPSAAPHPVSSAVPAEAERRQLTVMFCDLAGSTELSGRLDPEDYRAVIASFQATCAGAITRLGGFVAKYMGDGVLVYFGYPLAHEDDASRAVRAGLALIEEIHRVTLPFGLAPPQVRVGIATGLVVVGDLIGSGSAQEQSIAGETPNLAARLQALAPPNGLVISASTRRLIGAEFELQDLGATPLKGFADPVPTWRVKGIAQVQSRFAARGGGANSLTGRQEEIELLVRRWEQACDGEGQAVLLSGEAGIGKSRVTRGFLDQIASKSHVQVQYQCSPYFTNSALHPIIEQIEHAAGLRQHEKAGEKLDKLESFLAGGACQVDAVVPFLAALLSIPTGERYATPAYDPRRQNELTVEAVIEHLLSQAQQQPLVILVEDVHWADPTTLELLDQLVSRITTNRVLLLVTFRAEFIPLWRGRPHVSLISLNRLSRRQGMELISRLCEGRTLPSDVLEQILARSDGIPLYLEELTKAVVEDSDSIHPPTRLSIPATLHDSLVARLDRYPAAKRVAQCSAVIGREFSYPLLAKLTPEHEPDLQAALQQLVSAELIFARGTPPDATYTFKHALVRDAAYESLLKSRRQELHALIAAALEADLYISSRQPELVAYHLGEARLPERAVGYWGRAANGAAARHAHQEAIGHCARGLEAARLIQDQTKRLQHELELQVRLGNSAIAAKGWSAPEVGQAFYRARELCAELQDERLLHSILVGLFYFHSFQAELHLAEALGLELLTLGEVHEDRVLQVGGHKVLVDIRYKLAKFEEARQHLERGMGLYEVAPWPEVTAEHLDDPGPNLLIYGSVVLWVLGYPDKAKQTAFDAVALARRGGHRLSIAHTVYMAGHLAELAGDWDEVQRSNDETAALAEEWGLMGLRQQVARRDRLVAVALRSDPEEIAYKRKNPQPGFARSLHEGVVAQALGRTGQPEEGLPIVEAAVQWSEETSSFFYHAELHRIWAELLVQTGRRDEAEHALGQALTIARQQGAKMWELRVSHDLAHLWRDQGRSAEAYDLLAPIYQWFSEGFDTRDLQTAHALLEALSPSRAAV